MTDALAGAGPAAHAARKPLIGVVPLVDYVRESYWMLPGYFEGLEHAGAIPLMLPLAAGGADVRQLVRELDGLLFTGGHDVDPALYGQAARGGDEYCPERDRLESSLLHAAIEADLAVLGICRGIQFMNAALGGTLYQDLPTQLPSGVEHHMSAPYARTVHDVELLEGTPLRQLLGVERLAVNSYHHQGVHAVAPCLQPMAVAPDGLVEAVCLPGRRFVWAVQWHPEFMPVDDAPSAALFAAFVATAGQ